MTSRVSDVTRPLAHAPAGLALADKGEHSLKVIAEPILPFEVRGRT